MNIFLRKNRSKIKHKIKVNRNISRSLTYGDNKIIIKTQNTNKHIYVRVIDISTRLVLCTFSTIKHSKQKTKEIVYKMQMIPLVVDDLINKLISLDLISKINKSSIIWDISGGTYSGRIKSLIDQINIRLDVELNKQLNKTTK